MMSLKEVASTVRFLLIGATALIVLLLVSIVLLPVSVWAFVRNIAAELRFKRRMKTLGRVLTKREFVINLLSGGSLIIESPTLGWRITRAWWTPDNVLKIAPVPPATREEQQEATRQERAHKWDCWCWDNYTSPESGRGFLLRVWNGASIESSIKRKYPLVVVVHTWTGPILWQFRKPDSLNSSQPGPTALGMPETIS